MLTIGIRWHLFKTRNQKQREQNASPVSGAYKPESSSRRACTSAGQRTHAHSPEGRPLHRIHRALALFLHTGPVCPLESTVIQHCHHLNIPTLSGLVPGNTGSPVSAEHTQRHGPCHEYQENGKTCVEETHTFVSLPCLIFRTWAFIRPVPQVL